MMKLIEVEYLVHLSTGTMGTLCGAVPGWRTYDNRRGVLVQHTAPSSSLSADQPAGHVACSKCLNPWGTDA